MRCSRPSRVHVELGGGVCLCCVCDNMWGREAVSSTNRQSKNRSLHKGFKSHVNVAVSICSRLFSWRRSDICLFLLVIIQRCRTPRGSPVIIVVCLSCSCVCALSGYCAPMLPLRGCRVSMLALGRHFPPPPHSSRPSRHAQPAQGGVVVSSCSSDVAVKLFTSSRAPPHPHHTVTARLQSRTSAGVLRIVSSSRRCSVNVQYFSHHVSLRAPPQLRVVHECILQGAQNTGNR